MFFDHRRKPCEKKL